MRHLTQVRRARILGVVHAVAETGDLHLAREHAAHDLVDALARRGLPQIEQQLHHFGVGAAVERPLQGADGAGDRRIDVGQRGRGDAGGKGRRVELVVRVQDERHVERLDRSRVGTLARQHVEEVRGVPHHRVGRDRPAAGLQASPRGDDRRRLRDEALGLAVIGLRGRVVDFGIVVRERRDERAQRVHAVDRRQRPHQPQDGLRQRPRGGKLGLQVTQLGAVRQPPVPEQVADLFEGRSAGEIVDVVAAVGENAAVAIEVTDCRVARDNVFEPGLGLFRGRHGFDRSRSRSRSTVRGRRSCPQGRRLPTGHRRLYDGGLPPVTPAGL